MARVNSQDPTPNSQPTPNFQLPILKLVVVELAVAWELGVGTWELTRSSRIQGEFLPVPHDVDNSLRQFFWVCAARVDAHRRVRVGGLAQREQPLELLPIGRERAPAVGGQA